MGKNDQMSRTMRINIREDRPEDRVHVRKRRHTSAAVPAVDDSDEYTRLLQSVYDGVLITDGTGIITDLNTRVVEFLGVSESELQGQSVMRFISGGSEDLLDAVWRNLDEHRFTLIEAYCVRGDGSMFPSEIAVNRVGLSEDRQLGFFIRDVTVRRQAEEAREQAMARLEEMDRTRAQFVANVSHELRTPLTSMIYAIANLLRGVAGPVPQRIREYLELLDANCNRLHGTVNDILDLRKIEANTLVLSKSKVPVAGLVRKCVESLSVQARQKRQSIRCDTGHQRWFVACDVRKMERVLLNVLGNAIKFTPEGGEITVGVRGADEGTVEVSVTDSGIGIPAEEIGKVMQRYYTVGLQPTGSGLGLAIAREIVEMHGGRIGICSPAPGTELGTRVWVLLPVVASARIVIVSGNETRRQRLADHLGQQGYEVTAVSGADDVLDSLADERPDLVLADLGGCEDAVRGLILRLRSERATMRMPIVVLCPHKVSGETGAILNSFSIPTLPSDCSESHVLDSVTETLFLSAGSGEPSVLRVERIPTTTVNA